MKKINMKPVLITCMVIFIATAGAFASSESMKAIMQKIKTNKETVNQSLVLVNQQQHHVISLKVECAKEAVVRNYAQCKDWKSAQAVLKTYRAELKKNEKSLMEAHRAHICEHEREVRAQVRELEKAQRAVDRDFAKRANAVLPEADILMNERAELRNRMTDLERARLDRDKDRFVINKELMDMNGKTELQLSMNEDAAIPTVAVK